MLQHALLPPASTLHNVYQVTYLVRGLVQSVVNSHLYDQ